MTVATHLIKVKGIFDDKKWTEKQLENFVNDKINNEIESIYHPDLELFQINDKIIEVWIYVHALLSEVSEEIIRRWIKDHIKEEGLTVENLAIEKSGNGFSAIIP